MSTNFAHLPPLPPMRATLVVATVRAATPGARAPSPRRESLLAAMTLLLVGISTISVLSWTAWWDTTQSHLFVTAAAVLTVILPEAAFGILRATNRRRQGAPVPSRVTKTG